jgi:hypothetical protein
VLAGRIDWRIRNMEYKEYLVKWNDRSSKGASWVSEEEHGQIG